jgi:hypothetical protein
MYGQHRDKAFHAAYLYGRHEVNLVYMPDSGSTRSTRFPEELDEDFEEYRDKRGMTNSEALRSLVRDGLRDDSSPQGAVSFIFNTAHEELSLQLRLLGWMLFFAGGMLSFFNSGIPLSGLWLFFAGFFLIAAILIIPGVLAGAWNGFSSRFGIGTGSDETTEAEA